MNKWKNWPINVIEKNDFPAQLRKIKNSPEKLFYRGIWDNRIFEKSLAIVGSRRMSRYGREVIAKFVPELISKNITIISGFMYGVDVESHQKCLEFQGKTVAVLGGGLDILTPTENDELYCQILEKGGLVVSEYEANLQPTLWSFPQRNRIVSGLSTLGVLVVEAGMKSGSLITARLGREQGKEVYVIPGQINNSIAEGCNYLIKNNLGKLVTGAEDILGNRNKVIQEDIFQSLQGVESKILELLKIEALSLDELSQKTKLSISEINTKISLMSLNGFVFEENGKIFLKR